MPDDALPDYDRMVATYETHAEPGTGAFAASLVRLAGIAPGERVLDVATGTGALLTPLLDAGASVLATDLSQPMIDRIATRYPVEAQVMDGQALTLPDQAFDAVLSLFGVMLFPDHALGVREMIRVVRPGGRIAIGCWSDLAAPMKLLSRALERVAPAALPIALPPGVAVLGNAATATALLVELGLADVRCEQLNLPWPTSVARMADDAARLFASMSAWEQLEPAQRAAAETAMHDIAADTPVLDSTALLTVATRR